MAQATSDELKPIFTLLIQLAAKAYIEAMTAQEVLIQHAPELARHLTEARQTVRDRLKELGNVDQVKLEDLLSLLGNVRGPTQ